MKGSRKDYKMNVQARYEEKISTDKPFSFSTAKENKKQIQTTESEKKTFAEVSQCMFSEIMSAFTEVAEIKTKE